MTIVQISLTTFIIAWITGVTVFIIFAERKYTLIKAILSTITALFYLSEVAFSNHQLGDGIVCFLWASQAVLQFRSYYYARKLMQQIEIQMPHHILRIMEMCRKDRAAQGASEDELRQWDEDISRYKVESNLEEAKVDS